MENYTFEMMYEDLRNGYQIYYTYVRNRYLLFRTAKNCYTQKLISENTKSHIHGENQDKCRKRDR